MSLTTSEWITPVLSLFGALSGGAIAAWFSNALVERRERLALFMEATVAVESFRASSNGPLVEGYPGLPDELIERIRDKSAETFFTRHFDATFTTKVALGAIRRYDRRIAAVLDRPHWKLEQEDVPVLLAAIADGEERAMKWRRRKRYDDA